MKLWTTTFADLYSCEIHKRDGSSIQILMLLRRQKKKRKVAKWDQIFPRLHWWHRVGYNAFGLPLIPPHKVVMSQWGISFELAILLPIWVEEKWSNLALFKNFINLGDIRSYLDILGLQNCCRTTIPKLHLDSGTFSFQKVIQKITFPVTLPAAAHCVEKTSCNYWQPLQHTCCTQF